MVLRFKKNNIQYIVFRNKIFQYHIGNMEEKRKVKNEFKNFGINFERFL